MLTARYPLEASDRHSATTYRLMAATMAVILIIGPIVAARAQSPPKDAPTTSDPLVASNPLLAELQRIKPEQMPLVRNKLKGMESRPASGSRGGDIRPTAAEASQIAANPDFGRAFDRDPEDTLALLRFLNREMR